MSTEAKRSEISTVTGVSPIILQTEACLIVVWYVTVQFASSPNSSVTIRITEKTNSTSSGPNSPPGKERTDVLSFMVVKSVKLSGIDGIIMLVTVVMSPSGSVMDIFSWFRVIWMVSRDCWVSASVVMLMGQPSMIGGLLMLLPLPLPDPLPDPLMLPAIYILHTYTHILYIPELI